MNIELKNGSCVLNPYQWNELRKNTGNFQTSGDFQKHLESIGFKVHISLEAGSLGRNLNYVEISSK